MRNNEVQAHGIPLFCQVISYIGKVDFRKKKKSKKQWCWTINGFCSLVSVLLLYYQKVLSSRFLMLEIVYRQAEWRHECYSLRK